jgi:hypothetical protein
MSVQTHIEGPREWSPGKEDILTAVARMSENDNLGRAVGLELDLANSSSGPTGESVDMSHMRGIQEPRTVQVETIGLSKW